MILTSYIYDTISTLIRKDQHGNSFNIEEFNRIIKLINYELYTFHAGRIGEYSESTEALKDFIVMDLPLSLSSGVAALANAYDRMMGKPYILSGTDYVPVDIVTNLELIDRLSDELTKPTATHPIAVLGETSGGNSRIKVYPTDTATLYINYLTIPAVPILDYYIASTGLYVYLDEDATGISVPSGAVYSDGTPGPTTVASTTVDFEWHEDETPIIIDMILQKAGLVLEKQMPIEYGIAKETKEEQQ